MTKCVIISGGAGNLGRSVTKRLLDDGFHVSVTLGPHDSPDFMIHDALEAEAINLLDEEATEAYIKRTTAKHGELSAAVMLVGGFMPGDIEATNGAALEKMFRLNFQTAYFMTRPLMEVFKAQGGGQIIFTGTRPALKPAEAKNLVAYSLSKSLLFRLAEIINQDTKTTNVTATVLVPSTMDTPATRASMPDADFSHWVPTENVADAISFILSDTGKMLREPIFKIYNKA